MKRSKKNNYIVPVFFIIHPLSAIIPLFVELMNKKEYVIFWIALFFGLLGYITIPHYNDDLARHYLNFEILSSFTIVEFKNHLLTRPDFLLDTLSYFLSKVGFSKQILPFLAVFLGYYYKFKILDEESKQNKSIPHHAYFILITIFFLSTNFRSLSLGLRSSVAITLFVYGSYIYIVKNSKKGYLLFFFSIITHMMILPLVPLAIIAKKIDKTGLYRNIFIISFLFYIFNLGDYISLLIDSFGSSLGSIYESKASVYTDGYWGGEYILDLSFKGRVFQMISRIPVYVSLLYLIVYKEKSNFRNLAYIIGIITNSLSVFPVIFGRYSGVLVYVALILFLIEYCKIPTKKIMKKFSYIFLLVFALQFTSMIYSMRDIIIKSYPKMIYQTGVYIFSNEVNESDYILK